MTDPLSVSASISGLITLADIVFRRTYKYVKAVKKAPKEISALSAELGSLYGILSTLQLVSRQLEDETFDTSTRIHHVQSCSETLKHVKSILDKDDTSSLHDRRLETLRRRLRWPFTSSEVKDLIADIERHKATLGLALNVDCMAGLLQALSKQDEVRSTVEGIRTELKERHEAETRIAINNERREILQSFATVDPRSHLNMSRKLRSPGTGVWLTESQEFKQWMETRNAKLWYYGIPGAGKTVLASSVIEEALRTSNPSTAVAFFYCDYKDPATQELSNILGSLAQQFAKQDEDSFAKLRDFYEVHNPEHQPNVTYDSDALSTLVKEMTLVFDDSIIIIDGLDECGRNASVVVDALAAFNEGDDSTIKTIFLSRDEIDIRERLEGYTKVSIAARSSDLTLYVGAEIEIRMRKGRLRIKDQSLKEYIMERLVKCAEGMFRWVTCQMDYLCDLPNDAARRKGLDSLPPDLNSTYERILDRVNQSNPEARKLVRRALRWIANGNVYFDLTIEALCEAVSINFDSTQRNPEAIPDEFEILHRCSSLVRKSEDGKRLELAHFTVKEFLQQIDPKENISFGAYRYDPEDDELIFAKVCLTYLMFDNFGQCGPFNPEIRERSQQEYPFRPYAVASWRAVAYNNPGDAKLFALTQKLLDPSKPNTLILWAQDVIFWLGGSKLPFDTEALSIIDSGIAESTPLHYAAMCGLARVCDWLIGSGCDVNRNTKFGTPLHFAILEDSALSPFAGSLLDEIRRQSENVFHDVDDKVITLLLDSGADPNCDYSTGTGQLSPLFLLLNEGSWNLAIQLLDKGGRLDSSCLEILENHSPCEDVCRLIEHVGDHSVVQGNRDRLFRLALRVKTPNAARLIPKQKDLLCQNTHSEQSLRTAAEYGQMQIILDLLEDQSLDINAADERTGLTALHHAAKTDQLGVAQILLDRGADLSRLDNLRRTALHHCVLSGQTHCLRFFLQKNPDISDRDLEGMTIWHLAAQEGNLEALSVLSTTHEESESFIGLEAYDGATALLYASKKGNVEAVSLLLSAGSNLNVTDSDGCTPLHYAAMSGNLEAVEFLVEKKGLSNLVTRDGSTALHYAVAGSWKKVAGIVRILIEIGVDPCKARIDGCTPLHVLVSMIRDDLNKYDDGRIDKAFTAGQTLLEKMLENLRSESSLRLGSELIYLGCSNSFARANEVVLSLLNLDLELNVRFANGKTALMAAAERGYDAILKTLLLRGADPCIEDHYGNNAIHFACWQGQKRTLALLRDTSIDWNLGSAFLISGNLTKRVTALHLAAFLDDSSTLEYLLNESPTLTIDACTDKGETPLLGAVRQSALRNVSLLLSNEADTTVIDSTGDSAIHWAAQHGQDEIISEFIKHGSNLGLPNGRGLTPELVAIKYGHGVLAKTIIDYVNEKNNESNALTHNQVSGQTNGSSEAFKVAVDVGDIKLCTRLVQDGADFESGIEECKGCTPFLYSLHKEQYDISKYLVAEGATTAGSTCDMWQTRGFTALHYAVASGEAELLRLLLERSPCQVFLDHDQIHPIHLAVLYDRADCVRLILEHISQGTDFYSIASLNCTDAAAIIGKGRTLSDQLGNLQEALGRILNVQVRGIDFGWQWYDGYSPRGLTTARPLHIAARIGNSQIGSMLFAHGASVDSVDAELATPLHNAADHDSIAMVELLLEAGANPNALDRSLQSPAMRAAENGHVTCVQVLLEAGADIQLRDIWGQTALHIAAKSRAKDMFIFLISKMSGYELATEDTYGRSVLFWAMCEQLAFPMSFLLSLNPSAAVYTSQTHNILNAAIYYRSTIEFKMLLRRIPADLLQRLLDHYEPLRGTPIHATAIDGKLDMMSILLDTGAQLEIEACDHGTALMGACATGRLAAVKFLVVKGARTSYMQDGQCYSAYLAAKYHPEVRRWLLVGRFVEGPKLLTYRDVEEEK